MSQKNILPHIVIVGGGAGGLILAAKLGDSLAKKHQAKITLVDASLFHVWKPLWHEVAAGTLASKEDEINYMIQAYRHHFSFQWGSMEKLDRRNKCIMLSSVLDSEKEEIFPARTVQYDLLVIAVGSVSNDFNVPGVKSYCYFLDSYFDCQRFQQQLLKHLMLLSENRESALNIIIIGGGATGVELAAELQFVCIRALEYQSHSLQFFPQISISIIENSPRILPALPENISDATLQVLKQRKIKVFSGQKVVSVTETEIRTDTGLSIMGHLKIWCAGIQAPEFLKNLDIETNERNQIVVKQNLQSTTDSAIFAFGDCAYCFQPNLQQSVPPRAQAAYQQALLLTKSLKRYIAEHKSLLLYEYKDYGSLISLSRRKTLGILRGRWLGTIALEGKFAQFAYLFLYRRHQAVLWGWWSVVLLSLSQLLVKAVQPQLKLH